MIILGYYYVAILFAKILIWPPFLQSMCTFSFCINPYWQVLIAKIQGSHAVCMLFDTIVTCYEKTFC